MQEMQEAQVLSLIWEDLISHETTQACATTIKAHGALELVLLNKSQEKPCEIGSPHTATRE